MEEFLIKNGKTFLFEKGSVTLLNNLEEIALLIKTKLEEYYTYFTYVLWYEIKDVSCFFK